MDKNEALLRRLEQYDANRFDDASVRFFDDNESMFHRHEISSAAKSSSPGIAGIPATGDSIFLENFFETALSPREFEVILEQTRVYARAQSNDCDVSFTSSAIRTNAWSALSGLSLNDISVISVLALPISWEEVDKIGSHGTFAGILSGVQPPKPTKSPNSQTFLSSRRNGLWARPTRWERPGPLPMPTTSAPVLQSPSSLYTHKVPSPFLRPQIQGPGGVGMMLLHQLVVLGSRSGGKSALVNQIQVRSGF